MLSKPLTKCCLNENFHRMLDVCFMIYGLRFVMSLLSSDEGYGEGGHDQEESSGSRESRARHTHRVREPLDRHTALQLPGGCMCEVSSLAFYLSISIYPISLFLSLFPLTT